MHTHAPLRRCAEAAELRPELQAYCSQFGTVERLDVLTAAHHGEREAICFLRMGSEARQQQLMQNLGADRVGEWLVFVTCLDTGLSSTLLHGAPRVS